MRFAESCRGTRGVSRGTELQIRISVCLPSITSLHEVLRLAHANFRSHVTEMCTPPVQRTDECFRSVSAAVGFPDPIDEQVDDVLISGRL